MNTSLSKVYRKKPIEIEAVRFPDDGPRQCEVARWVESNGGKLHLIDGLVQHNIKTSTNANWHWLYGSVETLEGTMNVHIGDYVIKGIKGEFYPCKPDIFEDSYDHV